MWTKLHKGTRKGTHFEMRCMNKITNLQRFWPKKNIINITCYYISVQNYNPYQVCKPKVPITILETTFRTNVNHTSQKLFESRINLAKKLSTTLELFVVLQWGRFRLRKDSAMSRLNSSEGFYIKLAPLPISVCTAGCDRE